MTKGGSLFTTNYHGTSKLIDHRGLIGPLKGAREAGGCLLADDRVPRGIRVHAISPRPIPTREALGFTALDVLMSLAIDSAPAHQVATNYDAGVVTVATKLPARR